MKFSDSQNNYLYTLILDRLRREQEGSNIYANQVVGVTAPCESENQGQLADEPLSKLAGFCAILFAVVFRLDVFSLNLKCLLLFALTSNLKDDIQFLTIWILRLSL